METTLSTKENAASSKASNEDAAKIFVEVYQVTLIHVEHHLNEVIEDAGTIYAQGYQPWQEALHNLLNGANYLARQEKIPDVKSFIEALSVFSFKSSARFLNDLCLNIGIKTGRKWPEEFRKNIENMLWVMSCEA